LLSFPLNLPQDQKLLTPARTNGKVKPQRMNKTRIRDSVPRVPRERLTITLRKDILKRIDTYIDGTNIRNRSHAIESILGLGLYPKISKAVILAGYEGIFIVGQGQIPKPMIMVKGRPVIEYTLLLLGKYDIRECIVTGGPHIEKIKRHLSEKKIVDFPVCYIIEDKPLGTAGAVSNVRKHVADETFLVIHGDVLVEINLSDFIDFHRQREDAVVSLALSAAQDPHIFGVVKLRGDRITNFMEKPKEQSEIGLVNAGVYLLNSSIFSYLPKAGKASMFEDVFPILAKEGKLYGYAFDGKWFDISRHDFYKQAQTEWQIP
jgi:NDP-sugar pyrophosphorylase family protein